MEIVFVVFSIVMSVPMIIGLVKENKIRAKYKGVFGRPKAYLFMGGIITLPGMIVMTIMGLLGDEVLFSIGGSIAWAVLAVVIAITTKKKCPAPLQKGLFLSMFWAGIGISVKIMLFFLPFLWKLGMPSTVSSDGDLPEGARDENGNYCHIRNGFIYRADGSDSPVRRTGDHDLMDADYNRYTHY